jgi:hypothetical protein
MECQIVELPDPLVDATRPDGFNAARQAASKAKKGK